MRTTYYFALYKRNISSFVNLDLFKLQRAMARQLRHGVFTILMGRKMTSPWVRVAKLPETSFLNLETNRNTLTLTLHLILTIWTPFLNVCTAAMVLYKCYFVWQLSDLFPIMIMISQCIIIFSGSGSKISGANCRSSLELITMIRTMWRCQ